MLILRRGAGPQDRMPSCAAIAEALRRALSGAYFAAAGKIDEKRVIVCEIAAPPRKTAAPDSKDNGRAFPKRLAVQGSEFLCASQQSDQQHADEADGLQGRPNGL